MQVAACNREGRGRRGDGQKGARVSSRSGMSLSRSVLDDSSAPEPLVHPATALVAWAGDAVAFQQLGGAALGVACALVIGMALALQRRRFIALLHRSRWLLLAMLAAFVLIAPTQSPQGWVAGVWQVVRLAALLAGLALVLGAYGRTELLAGIYTLLRPLSRVGGCAERVAVRLWLTLHYVEQADPKARRSFADLGQPPPLSSCPTEPSAVVLPALRFSWRDAAALAALVLVFGLLRG